MENEKETKKSRKFWKGLALVVGTTVVCYEVFGRKGQDVKQACEWIKNKVKKQQPAQQVEVEGRSANSNQQYQNRGDQNHGNWNNKRNNN